MLKILLPTSPRDKDYLSQMHQLRYERFVVQFGWKDGLHEINQMEFDNFDYSAPLYLANIGENGRVNSVIRLIQTTQPNYTFDVFKENARMTEIQRAPDIVELSTTCTDRKDAPKNALSLLMTGLMELGLACKIDHYISTSSELMLNITSKLQWQPEEIGPRIAMGEQDFVILKYPVNREVYENFRMLHGFSEPLLTPEEIERCKLKQRIQGI